MDVLEEKLRRLKELESRLSDLNKSHRTCKLTCDGLLATQIIAGIQSDIIKSEKIITEEEANSIILRSRRIYLNIKSFINQHLGITKKHISFKTLAKLIVILNRMAQLDFKTATALVQVYDGSAENIDSFIDSVNFLKEISGTVPEQTIIKFVKTRLTGKARLGLPPKLDTVDQLLKDVKTRCQIKLSPDNITNKLKCLKVKETQSLCDEIEILTTKLKNIYLEQNIPENVANDMTVKIGVTTLIEKIENPETRLLLKAGTFSSVSAACEKAIENETSNSSQILPVRPSSYGYNYQNNFQQPPHFSNNRYPNRFQYQSFNQSYPNYNRYNNNYDYRYQNNNNFRNRNYSNGRQNRNNNNYNNRRGGNNVNRQHFEPRNNNNNIQFRNESSDRRTYAIETTPEEDSFLEQREQPQKEHPSSQ